MSVSYVVRKNPAIPCASYPHHPHTVICISELCPDVETMDEDTRKLHGTGLLICCECTEPWPCQDERDERA